MFSKIDGKIINILARNDYSASCPICCATSEQFGFGHDPDYETGDEILCGKTVAFLDTFILFSNITNITITSLEKKVF